MDNKCVECGGELIEGTLAGMYVACFYPKGEEKKLKGKKSKTVWRIIVGIIAIAYIVYMWVEKDIMTIYTTMPKEQVVPLIATTIAVSLIKVAAIAGGILLIKWIISKFKNK